jgi:hypothetical protein
MPNPHLREKASKIVLCVIGANFPLAGWELAVPIFADAVSDATFTKRQSHYLKGLRYSAALHKAVSG